MGEEAIITVNSIRLTETECTVIRLALASLADILVNGRIALTDQYRSDVAHVLALIESR